MKPVGTNIFVEEIKKQKSDFEVVGNDQTTYRVAKIGKDVSLCKKGDFLLFTSSRTHEYKGQTIIIVNENDVIGVEACTSKSKQVKMPD